MAVELKALYLQKCQDFACEPVACFLEDIEQCIKQSKPLTAVSLNGNSKRLFNNRLQYLQVFAICEALYKQTSVGLVDLSYNFLDNTAAQAISRLLQHNKGIRMLNVLGNNIGPEGAKAICEALHRSHAGLQALILQGNPIGDPGALAVAEMLRHNKSLTILDLAACEVCESGLVALSAALCEVNTRLEVLSLEKPLLKLQQGEVAMHMARMISSHPSLTELLLGKSCIVDSQLETLVAYGFSKNSRIRTLDLRCNRLSPNSGETLTRLLQECKGIESLNLSHNRLGNDGVAALAAALPQAHNLTRLDLRGNSVDEVGLLALAAALPSCPKLERVLVWGNNFGPASSEAFHAIKQRHIQLDIRPYVVDSTYMVALEEGVVA